MPNQQDFAQGQLNNLNYMVTGQNPFQGFHPFGADVGGQLGQQFKGLPTLSQYQTKPMDLSALQNLVQQYLGTAQNRALGTAGQGAGAYAASRGLNPYAFIQHAQAPIYGEYANEQGQAATRLPQLAFESQLGANQANFANLARLLGIQQGYAGMLPQQGPDFGSALGGLLGAGVGAFGGPLLGAAGAGLGKQIFK